MGVGIYYFYHGFGLEAFEGRHIRITCFSMLMYIYIGMFCTTNKKLSTDGNK